jgi:hypothetical protein
LGLTAIPTLVLGFLPNIVARLGELADLPSRFLRG